MKDGHALPVVAAVVVGEDGRVLLARRHPGGPHGGLWEFPGGKVEEGESPEAALVREIREELGVQISVSEHLLTVDHAYPHLRIALAAYACRIVEGTPHPRDCWEVAWVAPGDLGRYPMPEADLPIARRLNPPASRGETA